MTPPGDRPAPSTPGTAVLGLAGRPGQRRAVRVIAVALGLLAVAFGAHDALLESPADEQRPASTAPAAPQEPQSTRGGRT